MSLYKQQTLASVLGCKATHGLSRIGSHNSNWDSIESDDLIELLVDGALVDGGMYDALKLRALSRTFHRVVDAALPTALEEARARAEAEGVAAREAAAAAAARRAMRIARRRSLVFKLEAVAEAIHSNVPSISTLERLQDLEDHYGIEHAVPRRPLPPYRVLPLHRVAFRPRLALLREHIQRLA